MTAKRLRALLDYDSATGLFRLKVGRGGIRAGTIAGSLRKDGYRIIRIDWNLYYASRLAWLYVHGRWPLGQIDHKNGMHDDNRIENLRDVSPGENKQNMKRAHHDNKIGLLGVTPHHGRFRAQICVNGKVLRLGCFSTAAAAHEAYIKAKRELHPAGML